MKKHQALTTLTLIAALLLSPMTGAVQAETNTTGQTQTAAESILLKKHHDPAMLQDGRVLRANPLIKVYHDGVWVAEYVGKQSMPLGIASYWKMARVLGRPDGTYGPQEGLTRAEFATYLYRAFKLPDAAYGAPFGDVEGHWAANEIAAAYAAGITNGTSALTFSPDQFLRQEEAATMLWRFLKKQGLQDRSAEITFAEPVDAWAVEASKNMVAHSLYVFAPVRNEQTGAYYFRAFDKTNRDMAAGMFDLSMQKLGL